MTQINAFNQVNTATQLSHFDVSNDNQLQELSPIGKLGRNIADAFRSLSASGRSAIAARNERVISCIETLSKRDGASLQDHRAVLNGLKRECRNFRMQALNKNMAPLLDKVDARFGKNSPQSQLFQRTMDGAHTTPLASALSNVKFMADVLLNPTDKHTAFDAKACDAIKKEFQAEFTRNSEAPAKQTVGNNYIQDARRNMVTNFGDIPVRGTDSVAVHAERMRTFVGEANKDYTGALSFMSSQAGIAAIVGEQGRHVGSFDFLSAQPMSLFKVTNDGDEARIALTQDDNNFYVRCEASQNYTYSEEMPPKDDDMQLRNNSYVQFTIPKGQVAPEGVEKFLPHFTVQASADIAVRP